MIANSLARQIVSRVCREYKNSDLRADNHDILAAFDKIIDGFIWAIGEKDRRIQALLERERRLPSDTAKLKAEIERLEDSILLFDSLVNPRKHSSIGPINEIVRIRQKRGYPIPFEYLDVFYFTTMGHHAEQAALAGASPIAPLSGGAR